LFTTLVTAVAEGLKYLRRGYCATALCGAFLFQITLWTTRAQFHLNRTKFENLQIAGCKRKSKSTSGFSRRFPPSRRNKEYKNNAEFRKMALDPYESNEAWPEPSHGAILCSIVNLKKMNTACPGVERKGHCFVIPKFGKLFWAKY